MTVSVFSTINNRKFFFPLIFKNVLAVKFKMNYLTKTFLQSLDSRSIRVFSVIGPKSRDSALLLNRAAFLYLVVKLRSALEIALLCLILRYHRDEIHRQ